MMANFWFKLLRLLPLCAWFVVLDVLPHATFAYNSSDEFAIGYDAISVLATSERKNGTTGDRVSFFKFDEFPAAKSTTVIGHLPDYVNVVEKMGANYHKATPNWNWRMQGDFIKGVVERGDDVFIGTPIREGPSVLKHEIKQLIKAGYEPVEPGSKWLIKGAE